MNHSPDDRLKRTATVAEVATHSFNDMLAKYHARKAAGEPPVQPTIEPPPNKPLHLLTDDELQRGVRTCSHCHGRGILSHDVPVTDERFGKVQHCPDCFPFKEEQRRREQYTRMAPRIARYSLLRGDLLTCEFANFDRDRAPDPHDAIYEWAKTVIGRGTARPWVYVYGEVGNGKSHLSAAAANGLTRAHIPLIFGTMPDTLAMITDAPMEARPVIIRYLQTVPVLILDDFGTEKATDYKLETTFRIINWRYTERLPTLFSSNIPPLHLPEIRISSRIKDKAVCNIVLNAGDDYRKLNIEERQTRA